jgi:hypothetical protein
LRRREEEKASEVDETKKMEKEKTAQSAKDNGKLEILLESEQ